MIFAAWRKRAQLQALEKALPDALTHLARLLRAGQGLSMALATLSEKLDEPLKGAIEAMLLEHRQGRSLESALNRLTTTYPLPDLQLMGVAIRVQRETGGNLAELMERLAYTLRDRQLMRMELLAYTAEARLSAAILSILPFLCVGGLYLWRSQDLIHFAHAPMGQVLLLAVSVAILLGVVMTRALLRALENAL